MRSWFGGRDQDADDEQDREEYAEGDDQNTEGNDSEDDSEDGEETTQPEDAARQAQIQEEAGKLAAKEIAKIRTAAQRRGLDWTGDDFGVTDYQRASQAFGFQHQERERLVEQPEADDPEPEIEDVWDADSLRKHTAWQIRQATKQMASENQRLQRLVIENELARAIDRVPDAIKRYAPHFEEILDHPDFAKDFRAALATQAPELWADSRNLARVAAMLSVDLDREQIPKKEQSRDEERRPTPGEQRRNQIGQLLPSRGTGQPSEDDLTAAERQAVRAGWFDSPEEARATRPGADGTATYEAYEKYLIRQKARAAKR